jgi:pilus assembly protein Flp/PilA
MEKIWKFIKDEDGLELVEYAVMGALIVLGVVITIGLLGNQINTRFNQLLTAIGGGGTAE